MTDRIEHDNPHDLLGTPLPPARTPRNVVVTAAVTDALTELTVAAIGRASHVEALGLAGLAETAWPFLAALLVGWLVLRAHRAPRAAWPTGAGLWLVTWGGGMLLRAATGGGTATAFVIVALCFLGLFLVGWRLLARLLGGRSLLPGLSES